MRGSPASIPFACEFPFPSPRVQLSRMDLPSPSNGRLANHGLFGSVPLTAVSILYGSCRAFRCVSLR